MIENRERDRILAHELDRARSERADLHLISPSGQLDSAEIIAALIPERDVGCAAIGQQWLARDLQCSAGRTARHTEIRANLSLFFLEFEGRRTELIEIPLSWLAPMRCIAATIAGRVPPGALFDTEGQRLLRDGMIRTKRGGARSEILYLPVQSCGSHAYVFANAIAPSALEAIRRIIQLTHGAWADAATAANVWAAIRSILGQGYADGLRIVMSRFIPEMYDNPRLAPSEHAPWVLVQKDSVGVSRIRIAWARQQAGAM